MTKFRLMCERKGCVHMYQKSKWTALLLCIFFWWSGAAPVLHRESRDRNFLAAHRWLLRHRLCGGYYHGQHRIIYTYKQNHPAKC